MSYLTASNKKQIADFITKKINNMSDEECSDLMEDFYDYPDAFTDIVTDELDLNGERNFNDYEFDNFTEELEEYVNSKFLSGIQKRLHLNGHKTVAPKQHKSCIPKLNVRKMF